MTEKYKTASTKSSSGCTRCFAVHCNNLWSVWYGILCGGLQVCVALICLKRLLNYSVLSWPENLPLPSFEMNVSLGLTGAAVLLIPFFVISAIFKIGNLANDGHKLGRHLSACSKESASEQFGTTTGCKCWKFGGPTAPFLHLVIAFCLLLPKLLMEARLIEANFFPQDMIWRSDLNFLPIHKENFVVLNFMTLPTNETKNVYPKLPTDSPWTTTRTTENVSPSDQNIENDLQQSTLANTVVNLLKNYIGTDDKNYNVIEHERQSHISIEYINFGLALGVYAIRYASLFWASNKCLSLLFSAQLVINGIQILLSYTGVSILYKVQIMGGLKVLPFFKHQLTKSTFAYKSTPFLLNPLVSILLYILYILLIICSSLVFYLYGHIRFKNFLNQNCQRKVILLKEGNTSRWIYFTHCAALFLLIAIGVCSAPLFYDYTVVYRGSLDMTMLVCIIGGILHLFVWIVLWLFLTIKQNWAFKLRLTIGNTTVKQSNSIKLAAEVFSSSKKGDDNFEQPLLVASNGYIYSVTESAIKTDIVDILQRDVSRVKEKSVDNLSTDDNGDNQIYWLKSELFDSRNSHFKHIKEKCLPKSPSTHLCVHHDDGDYATLKKPEMTTMQNLDEITEVDKLLSEVHVMDISYANTNQDLIPIEEEVIKEEAAEELCAETSIKVNGCEPPSHSSIVHEPQKPQFHKCRKLTGPEELGTKYDSISMESSTSPPDHPDSETSSGVHSNESNEHHCNQQNINFQEARQQQQVLAQQPQQRVILEPDRERLKWKSCSLHRCTRPESMDSSQIASKYYSLNPTGNGIHEQYVRRSICPHNLSQAKNSSEDTLVICRKLQPFKLGESGLSSSVDDQFGRSTNMRMSSFENKFKHHTTFSTGPLLVNKANYVQPPSAPNTTNPGNTGNLYQRHTTIPSHHNGIELYNNQGHQFRK
nr:uncharacterized protein LOC111427199 [Onthophagus taurus]XP_022917979.1 uncharacterized protein LOC111427199 [Onthophagus taurus]